MKLRRRPLLAAAGWFMLTRLAHARDEWDVLGTRSVRLAWNRDIIHVGLNDGLFSGIRLEVSGSAIFFERLRVVFSNGEEAKLPVRRLITDGGSTREIMLPGLVRGIRSVELIYRRAALQGTAQVTIYGRRAYTRGR